MAKVITINEFSDAIESIVKARQNGELKDVVMVWTTKEAKEAPKGLIHYYWHSDSRALTVLGMIRYIARQIEDYLIEGGDNGR